MTYSNRVLITDDDPEILEVFKSILGGDGESSGRLVTELEGLLAEESGGYKRSGAGLGRRVFAVDVATQGEAGFEMVKAAREAGSPFALVFIDMRMPPGWDGIKTAREIRRLDPTIQIVIVTAFSDASISEIVEKVGFTDRLLYLKKPFDDEEILQLADSLSMRWNLERKVEGFMTILEGVISSIAELRLSQDDNALRPFLQGLLRRLADFLDTPDIFLARIENGCIQFRIGLGKFDNGIADEPVFREIVRRLTHDDSADGQVFRVDEYVVMPILLTRCRNIVVGIRSEHEIEGADSLLKVLAANVAKVFDMAGAMAELSREVDGLRQHREHLLERIRVLEAKTGEEEP